MQCSRILFLLSLLSAGMLTVETAEAISLGQVDDFQGGTVLEWVEGPAGFPMTSPNPPSVVLDGGPLGGGDAFLQNVSSGEGSAGGRQVTINRDQWTGDYLAAGVTQIAMDISCAGTATLSIRVVLQGAGGTWYGSTNAFSLTEGDGWQSVVFNLSAAGLTSTGGPDSLNTVLGSVTEMRIVSAFAGPTHIGDVVGTTFRVDNIRAVPEPATWISLGVGAVLIAAVRRRRRK